MKELVAQTWLNAKVSQIGGGSFPAFRPAQTELRVIPHSATVALLGLNDNNLKRDG
jgi:hypothetical protein